MDKLGKRQAIFQYNHSPVYANTVLAIADKLAPEKWVKNPVKRVKKKMSLKRATA